MEIARQRLTSTDFHPEIKEEVGGNEVDSNIYTQARSIIMLRRSFAFGLSVLKTLCCALLLVSVLHFTVSGLMAHAMFTSLK